MDRGKLRQLHQFQFFMTDLRSCTRVIHKIRQQSPRFPETLPPKEWDQKKSLWLESNRILIYCGLVGKQRKLGDWQKVDYFLNLAIDRANILIRKMSGDYPDQRRDVIIVRDRLLRLKALAVDADKAVRLDEFRRAQTGATSAEARLELAVANLC